MLHSTRLRFALSYSHKICSTDPDSKTELDQTVLRFQARHNAWDKQAQTSDSELGFSCVKDGMNLDPFHATGCSLLPTPDVRFA